MLSTVMQPCEALDLIKDDMAKIVKEKDLPLRRVYTLGPATQFEVTLELEGDNLFRLEVRSARNKEEVSESNFKKVASLLPSLVWKVLNASLVRSRLLPCEPTAHKGSDEILALYMCIGDFRKEGKLPCACTVNGAQGKYELFTAKEKGGLCEMTFKTKYVYGNPLKVSSEVDAGIARDRAGQIVSAILGEWLKPDYVKTLRPHS